MKTRILAFVCVLCLLLSLAACGGSGSFSGGSGTEADPYLIGSAKDLQEMAGLINDKKTTGQYCKAYYKLTADIDLGGKTWEPMGIDDYGYMGFGGTLDGNGHTVSNFKVSYKLSAVGNPVTNHAFIGYLYGGTVRNLTVSNATVSAESDKNLAVSALVASARDAVIENCHVTDSVTVTSAMDAAGVVCKIAGSGVLKNCSNAGSVTAGTGELLVGCAGGVVHYADVPVIDCSNSGTVVSNRDGAAGVAYKANAGMSGCTNSGDVTADDYAAGIVCWFSDGALNHAENDDTVTLENCSNSGTVTSLNDTAGGIATVWSTGHIKNCSNTGDVTAPKNVGGMFGYFQHGAFGSPAEEVTISGCLNSGTVTCTENYSAGGIAGLFYGSKTKLVIDGCGNSGAVVSVGKENVAVAGSYAGGILGKAEITDMEILNCTNSGEITGYTAAAGIAGQINAANVEGFTGHALLIRSCSNAGKVYTVYPGGLTPEIYAGGILGYTTPEVVATDLLPMIADLRIEDCTNTGTLTGDTDGAPLITDDLCASWNNRLQ